MSVFSNPVPANSQDIEVAKEYKIKVAYIYNFARYIKWPGNAFAAGDSPFVIGILGNAPFGDTLQRLEKTKIIHNRRVVVRRFETPADYEPCQILFVTEGDYSVRVPRRSEDEIGTLYEQFNLMLERIQQGEQRLHEARDKLEIRVKERTAELEDLHKQLLETARRAGMAEVAPACCTTWATSSTA